MKEKIKIIIIVMENYCVDNITAKHTTASYMCSEKHLIKVTLSQFVGDIYKNDFDVFSL